MLVEHQRGHIKAHAAGKIEWPVNTLALSQTKSFFSVSNDILNVALHLDSCPTNIDLSTDLALFDAVMMNLRKNSIIFSVRSFLECAELQKRHQLGSLSLTIECSCSLRNTMNCSIVKPHGNFFTGIKDITSSWWWVQNINLITWRWRSWRSDFNLNEPANAPGGHGLKNYFLKSSMLTNCCLLLNVINIFRCFIGEKQRVLES